MLETHIASPNRVKFHKSYVSSLEGVLSVELKQKVLENSIPNSLTSSADNILVTLTTIYEKTINTAADKALVEDEPDE